MQLTVDQIVKETSDWPEDAVADLIDRILGANYGEVDPSVDHAWHEEIRRRISDIRERHRTGNSSRRDLCKSAKNHRPVKVVLPPQADAEFLQAQQRWTRTLGLGIMSANGAVRH
jgi:hypothetical protein